MVHLTDMDAAIRLAAYESRRGTKRWRRSLVIRFLIAAIVLLVAATSQHAQELLTIHAHEPSTSPTLVCFSPDGKVLATNGDVKKNGPAGMRLWDTKTGKMLFDITTWNSRTTILKEYDVGAYRYRLRLTERWQEELGHCFSVAFHRDGMTLAWGSGGAVQAWNGATGSIAKLQTTVDEDGKSFTIGNEAYHYIAFSPDGRSIAAAGPAWPYVAIWDAGTGKQRACWKATPSRGVRAVAFSPKGPYLAVIGNEDSRIRLWDLKTGKLRHSFGEVDDNFRALAFSDDGKRLAGAGKTVRVWDWVTDREVGPLSGFENGAQCMAFVPHKAVLMTGSRDGQLRAWDLMAKEQVASQLVHSGASNSNIVLPGDKYTSPTAGGVTSFAFSPDARRLATAGWDGVVKLWDVSDIVPAHPGGRNNAKKR